MNSENKPTVGLYVTCLVDLFRPAIGFAAIKLLEDAGCSVEVPNEQTCCGQPAYNMGDNKSAIDLGCNLIEQFERFDYVVVPSGSCAGMIKIHLPTMFNNNSKWQTRAQELAAKTYELTSFLVDVRGLETVNARFDGTATYHDACSGLRELNIAAQPRQLLNSVEGLTLREMSEPDVCCGFGGTFAVKYPDISNAMVSRKTQDCAETGADVILAGDLGCLMNIAGKLSRKGHKQEVRHIAEVLAEMTTELPIAGPDPDEKNDPDPTEETKGVQAPQS